MSEICNNPKLRRGLTGLAYTGVLSYTGNTKSQREYIVNAVGAILSDTILKDFTYKLLGQTGEGDVVKIAADSVDTAIVLFLLHQMFGGNKDVMNNMINGVGIEITDKLMKMVLERAC